MPGLRGTPAGITTTCVCRVCFVHPRMCSLYISLLRAPQPVDYVSPVCGLCVCPLCVDYVCPVCGLCVPCVPHTAPRWLCFERVLISIAYNHEMRCCSFCVPCVSHTALSVARESVWTSDYCRCVFSGGARVRCLRGRLCSTYNGKV